MPSLLSLLSGSVQAYRQAPVAKAFALPENGVIGAVVQLNGRSSADPGAEEPRSGVDAVTNAGTDEVDAASAAFSAADLGRYLTVSGADSGEYFICEVVSATQVRVVTPTGGGVAFTGGSAASWTIFDRLSYSWSFVSVPIGSQVRQEGFRLLDSDSSLVSFSPDKVGEYLVQLVVSNGAYDSEASTARSSIRAILVPHARGLVPDGKFIWNYVRDVWTQVDGKEWFETLWSALIQICGAEMLKLYQNDFAKSIRDIQDQYQRRWIAYEPKLDFVEDDLSFYLGNHCAGISATTEPVGLTGQVVLLPVEETPTTWAAATAYALGDIITPTAAAEDNLYFRCTLAGTTAASEPDWDTTFDTTVTDGTARWTLFSMTKELVVVLGAVFPNSVGQGIDITYDLLQPKNIGSYQIRSLNSPKSGYRLDTSTVPPDPLPSVIDVFSAVTFTFQSPLWTTASVEDIRVGDVAHFPAGPNAGFYRILSRDGTTLGMDRAPPSFSDVTTSATYSPTFYRPVGYRLAIDAIVTTDTFAVPYETGGNDVSVIAPGRIITVGAQAATVLRTAVAQAQAIPLTIISVDSSSILAGANGLNWRAPHTIVSESQNFEELGVSSGDLLILTITEDSSGFSVDVVSQVIGVDRTRLGFILTDELPVAGQVPDIPNKTYEAIADGLKIGTVTSDDAGELTFTDEFRALLREMGSTVFQRIYANTLLDPSSDIQLGARTFHVTPKHIIRNRLIPVDETLRSVPVLQEWIVQPDIGSRGGAIFQVKNGIEFPLTRLPISLIENSAYIIDSEYAFSGEMTFDSGTDTLFVEGANFLDRGIVPGDVFIIDLPSTLGGTYPILQVLDADRVLLTKSIPLYVLSTTVTATVRIERKRLGHFLRFTPGAFSALNPAPNRLWAEVSFFDNSETIENNFGLLVGLTKADLDDISSNVNYRQAVAGLMFAFTKGSAIEKVRLGAQILLGLPFAEHRGIIRSIEGDYRLDAAGDPKTGRLLVEDVASDGTPMGTQRVYTFAIDPSSELSGVETNPATDAPYIVGDIVELFALLAKGVEIADYLTTPETGLSAIAQLQQFHTFRLRANDVIFSIKELALLSPFLRKISPSYVSYVITTTMELEDQVEVLDEAIIRLGTDGSLLDNPYFGIDTALAYDVRDPSGIRLIQWDGDVFQVRKSGRNLVSVALAGSPGDPQVLTLAGGGLVTPTFGNGPVSRAAQDALLIVDGPNAGIYTTSAITDTSITVTDAPDYGFQPSTTNRYAVVRRVAGELRRGTLSSTASVGTCEVGLIADGVVPGDLLVVDLGAGAYSRHLVLRVGPHSDTVALVDGEVQVTPALGTLASKPYAIFRQTFVEAPYHETASLVSNGTAYTSFSDQLLQGLLEPGDELEVDDSDFGRLFVLDPKQKVFQPVLPAGTYSVKVCKKGQSLTTVAFDHLSRGPQDRATLALEGAAATTTASTDTVSLAEIANPATGGILPADMLAILSGADSTVDVGYGPGLYPIVEVSSSDVRLGVDLSSSGSVGWQIIRSA